jgi:thiaminase/transcriptional activator TenA
MDIFDRLKAAAAADWQSYVDHDFVRRMGAATQPRCRKPRSAPTSCRTTCF